ncbi:MAG TPA: dTDP-4-dehydrorhamnose reductase [Oligoflexus sp.]|uniref:dTDP-4-dehydrorhamnose reductase n=1 Tax=Oligoflexus sp. TaxID=1971216 RepID=UPI002D25B284|nr:dTDP-4-dehydrorhamnose reductase [Oligoflexus sp.]HYX37048.1 dTDP-4-dehydrorhamnose reductase [Oligoflexus sp.]
MKKRPRILLTGANGQVGFEIWQALAPLADVTAFKGPHDRTAAIPAESLDLCDAAAIEQAVRSLRPDLIINPAAYTAVDKAESEQERAFLVNATAPGIIGRVAREVGAAVMHFSTDYVYSGEGHSPYHEDERIAPNNVYGQSKWQGEANLMASGAAYITLRTSWVYGIYGHNFVKTMLKLGREKENLKIVNDQHGAPTSARTLANFTQHLVTLGRIHGFPATLSAHQGVYHLTDHGCTHWQGFAEEIFQRARAYGVNLAVKTVEGCASSEYPTPAKRPQNSRLSLSRIEESFGFQPPRWQDALGAMMAPLLGL